MTTEAGTPISEDAREPLERLLVRLIESGAVSASGVDRARRASEISNTRVDHVLLKLGLVDERAIADGWSELLQVPIADMALLPAEPILQDILSPRFLRHAGILPLRVDGPQLELAVLDPLDKFSPAAVAARTRYKVQIFLTSRTTFEAAFDRLYPKSVPAVADESKGSQLETAAGDVTRLRDLATDAPVIRFVDSIIEYAVERAASDIHLTANRNGVRLRYRVDGILQDGEPYPAELHSSIVSRFKVLAELDISERRLPQDGRIRYGVRGREIDLRIATMPHLEGEGVVARILDRSAVKLDLETLGLSRSLQMAIEALLGEPNGIMLVAGPTGSGKTTTLYAALRRLVRPELNVISVEDPVEYHLDGVAQIQVQRKIGLDFPTVLRAVLRQDPDVIMVGEIRDAETAAIANQAALTGHFVLATLHTNSAAAALPRLIDMGLEPYLLASTVRGVLSQRLLRRLCRSCAKPAGLHSVAALRPEGIPPASELLAKNEARIRQPVGCSACHHTGYAGRIAIGEALIVDDEIRTAILERSDARRLETLGIDRGMIPLIAAGYEKVLSGETSLAELHRVTGQAGDQ